MNFRRMMLLIGSSRKKGTSFSFGRTIKTLAEQQGFQVELEFIHDYFEGNKSLSDIRSALAQCHTIGLVTPMYVDTLPAPVIWFMEEITSAADGSLAGKQLFVVSQCGFPEIYLLRPSLESCRLFARKNSMLWLGGVGYGGGAIIDGTFLEDFGKKGRKITEAFRLLVEDVARSQMIRPEVPQILTVRFPRIFYGFLAVYLNRRTQKIAAKYGKDVRGPIFNDDE
jgi:hypothetical protein